MVSAPARAAACGPIPSTYPAFAAHTLDIKSGKINGSGIVDNAKNALSAGVLTPIPPNPPVGQVINATMALPPLHPTKFPANDSKVDSSALSIAPGYYQDIDASTNPATPTVFTASGSNPTWYIDKLTLGNAVLAPGTYFIKDLNAKDASTLVVSPPGQVRIYIDGHLDAKNDVSFNAGGAVGNLQVYLYKSADAKFDKNAVFTGLLYGPEDSNIDFKDGAVVTGALIAGHDVKLDKGATFNYPPAAQAAIAAISTCLPVGRLAVERAGGGPIASQTVGIGFNIQVAALDAYGNTVTGFSGPVTIASTGTLAQGAGSTTYFTDGVLASWPVTISNTGTFTISATGIGGTPGGTSNGFAVGGGQCSAVPSAYALYGGYTGALAQMEVNGTKVTPANCSGCNAVTPGGSYLSAPLTLPLADPFQPSGVSTTTSSSGTLAPGDYGTVNGNNLTFSGGIYRIGTLNSSGTTVFNAGTYHIDVFNGGTGSSALKLSVASGPVRIIVGTFMGTTANGSDLNKNGSAADLQIMLAPGATFSARDNSEIAGFIYGSASDNTISFRKDLKLTGAIVSAGTVAIGNKARITFGAAEQAALGNIRVCTPPVVIAVGPFNAYEPSTPAGAIAGVIQTKVAGQAFTLDLVAVNTARTAIQTAFTGPVTVELVDSGDNSGVYDATSSCRSSWAPIQTLAGTRTFAAANNGRISVGGIVEPAARRNVRVRVTWQPTDTSPPPPPVVGCSSDNFAIRPASFSAPVATDADWLTAGSARSLGNAAASGGVVHAAGAPFRVSFGARDAAGNPMPSYTGVPTLSFDGCALPLACDGASASSLSAWFGVAGGVASTDDARYSEAGSFVAHAQDATFAAVDAADTPAAQRWVTSPSVTIGRFVPANYLLSLATPPSFAPAQGTACTGNPAWNFTWIGQPFAWQSAPVVTITAQSAEGLVLAQYAGSLFKLNASALTLGWGSNAPVAAPFTASGQTIAVSSLGAGVANAAFGAGASFAFTRPATPSQPVRREYRLDRHAGRHQRVRRRRQRGDPGFGPARHRRRRRRHRVRRRQRERGEPGRLRSTAGDEHARRQSPRPGGGLRDADVERQRLVSQPARQLRAAGGDRGRPVELGRQPRRLRGLGRLGDPCRARPGFDRADRAGRREGGRHRRRPAAGRRVGQHLQCRQRAGGDQRRVVLAAGTVDQRTELQQRPDRSRDLRQAQGQQSDPPRAVLGTPRCIDGMATSRRRRGDWRRRGSSPGRGAVMVQRRRSDLRRCGDEPRARRGGAQRSAAILLRAKSAPSARSPPSAIARSYARRASPPRPSASRAMAKPSHHGERSGMRFRAALQYEVASRSRFISPSRPARVANSSPGALSVAAARSVRTAASRSPVRTWILAARRANAGWAGFAASASPSASSAWVHSWRSTSSATRASRDGLWPASAASAARNRRAASAGSPALKRARPSR